MTGVGVGVFVVESDGPHIVADLGDARPYALARVADDRVLVSMQSGEVALVLNTPSGGDSRGDGYEIRAAATSIGVPMITTLAEFGAAIQAIEAMREHEWSVTSLQDHDRALQEAITRAGAAQ